MNKRGTHWVKHTFIKEEKAPALRPVEADSVRLAKLEDRKLAEEAGIRYWHKEKRKAGIDGERFLQCVRNVTLCGKRLREIKARIAELKKKATK